MAPSISACLKAENGEGGEEKKKIKSASRTERGQAVHNRAGEMNLLTENFACKHGNILFQNEL